MKRFVHNTYDRDSVFKQIVDQFDPEQIEYAYSYLNDIYDTMSSEESATESRLGDIKDDYLMWLDDYSLDSESFDNLCSLLSSVNLNKIKLFLIEQGVITK